MKKRTRSRELALQFLYQVDLLGPDTMSDLTEFLRAEGSDTETTRYARRLVEGTFDAIPELDAEIQTVAQNWQIDRMAVIDRNVLRMAAFELMYCEEIPPKVAINEGIELGKRFFDPEFGRVHQRNPRQDQESQGRRSRRLRWDSSIGSRSA